MHFASKKEARSAAKARRRDFAPADWAALGQRISRKLFAMAEWQQAGTVFCFASTPTEPDTAPILRQALAEGKRLLLPRVVPDTAGAMELVQATDLAALRCSRYGILEPVGGDVVVPASLPPDTLAVIPCVAATRDGVRLGHGGGYYDRFLAEYSGKKLLLCPTALRFDELPTDAWDIPFTPAELLSEDSVVSD